MIERVQRRLRSYMMPVAMLVGIIFYEYLDWLSFVTPYVLMVMLFFSYCNISLRSIRPQMLHLLLLLFQIVGSLVVYFILSLFDVIVAEGIMVCVLAPTATSAVVITGMLGGDMGSLTTYSLLSNLVVAICTPIFFALIGADVSNSFWEIFVFILQRVCVLLILPFVCALLLRKFCPRFHKGIKKCSVLSFYLWSFALVIVTAKTVLFIMDQGDAYYRIVLVIAFFSLVICVLQFWLGRYLGRKFGDTVAGGQGLGQKNTILAIWMAQSYLSPLSSIGPGAYVLWQNIVNSYQVWQKRDS